MAAAVQTQSPETTSSIFAAARSDCDHAHGDEILARRTSPTRRTPLRLVPCQQCGVANFVSGDLPLLSPITCGRCQTATLIPMRLRQYELRGVLGVGGMGTVYQATDLVLQRDVAAKLIRPALAENPGMLEAFLREARFASSLNHTHIVAIHSLEECEGHSLLVMELAAGGSLQRRIADEGRLSELEVLDLGIKVASALQSALDQRLLHRDVKPGNILFGVGGEPKLSDFGLARALDAGDGEVHPTPWATPHYAAPERVLGREETFASDLYSLAATLYHAVTGVEPFNAPTAKEVFAAHVRTPLTPPTGLVAEISQPTSDALARALAKNPSDRYESYDAFIMALTAARSRLLVQQFGPRNETEPASSGAIQSKRRWLFAGSKPS